jgi:hypothetical protein
MILIVMIHEEARHGLLMTDVNIDARKVFTFK